jgi:hypothetical protein
MNRTRIFTSLRVYSLLTSPSSYPLLSGTLSTSSFSARTHQFFIFISAPQHNNALTPTQNNDWTLLIFTNARSLPPCHTLHPGRVRPRFHPSNFSHPLVLSISQDCLSFVPSRYLHRHRQRLVFYYLDLDWEGRPGRELRLI